MAVQKSDAGGRLKGGGVPDGYRVHEQRLGIMLCHIAVLLDRHPILCATRQFLENRVGLGGELFRRGVWGAHPDFKNEIAIIQVSATQFCTVNVGRLVVFERHHGKFR